ncbi:hypothetical protein LSTR_LSTR003009 [Laodelphax striatellus]|uniref:Carboxylesterase type B domain-containing protein n=1 Tax=Laodelphax striatellus TaxID=195883 RepID=A0A482XSF3_LAOST|nr:hypothetical protein LSTR_LSTR003009 [Laodelphax striatellus]
MFYSIFYTHFICLCFYTTSIICFINDPSYSPPKVSVGETEIVGAFKAESGFLYETFLGIPYAEAPVGKLRFKEPQPFKMTDDQFSATKYGNLCIQYSHMDYQIHGSEDCLYLNIFRPHININSSTPPLDVIVYIHGGAFMFGVPAHSIKLLRRNLIFVNFTYRLGPIGFMSTGDGVLPGNLGLKDQVAALKWVHDNIHYFHGNPCSVALSGLSAGAASVQLHMMSPLSKNLFSGAIMSSGSALNPWALAKHVVRKTRRLAAALNCTTDHSCDMTQCLRTKQAEQIVAQVPTFMKFLYVPFSPFGPVIESPISLGAFLTGHPYDLLKAGQVTEVPVIIGMVTGEGLYPVAEFIDNQKLLQQLDSDWTDMASYLLDFHYTLDENSLEQSMRDIREEYLHQQSVPNALHGLVQMVGDRLFGSGIAEGAHMYASVSNSPVYIYRFGYSGSKSLVKLLNMSKSDEYGVSHGSDCLLYIHDLHGFKVESKDDLNMSEMMVKMWGKFASNRVPQIDRLRFMTDARHSLPKLEFTEIESPSRIYVNNTDNMSNMLFWRKFLLKEKQIYKEVLITDSSSSSIGECNYFLAVMYLFGLLFVFKRFFFDRLSVRR